MDHLMQPSYLIMPEPSRALALWTYGGEDSARIQEQGNPILRVVCSVVRWDWPLASLSADSRP